jgi:hypothetical protein
MESHQREASSPWTLSNGTGSSGPLADPYRMGHGRPLGSPVSNSMETPCSAPSEGNMALPPFLLAERRRRGV